MPSKWPPDELVQAIAGESEGNAARCSVFIGAGLSQEAGYPGWNELMMSLVELCKPGRRQEYIAEMKNEALRDPLGFASWAKHQKQQGYYDLLDKCFRKEGKKSYTPCHRYLLQTGFQFHLTTNFDCCLENCAARLNNLANGVFYYPEIYPMALRDRRGAICHLHGTLYPQYYNGNLIDRRADQLVLTYEDYDQVYNDSKYNMKDLLDSVFQYQTVFFVGYSFTDPVLQMLLEQLVLRLRTPAGMNRNKHYALMPQTKEIKTPELKKEIFRDRFNLVLEFFPVNVKNGKTDFSELSNYLKELRDSTMRYVKRVKKTHRK